MRLGYTCASVATMSAPLREAGRAALLREQAEYYEIHALGLQETRSTIVDPCDSNFVRIIAGADTGSGGCELWLLRTKPYARSSSTSYFFPETARTSGPC